MRSGYLKDSPRSDKDEILHFYLYHSIMLEAILHSGTSRRPTGKKTLPRDRATSLSQLTVRWRTAAGESFRRAEHTQAAFQGGDNCPGFAQR